MFTIDLNVYEAGISADWCAGVASNWVTLNEIIPVMAEMSNVKSCLMSASCQRLSVSALRRTHAQVATRAQKINEVD